MLDWGFYCRTCGASSRRYYSSPEGARYDLEATRPSTAGELPAGRVQALDFLHLHRGHDLWAECDVGVLRLARGRCPEGPPPRLPVFAANHDGR